MSKKKQDYILEEKEAKMRSKDEDQGSVNVKSYLVLKVHKLGYGWNYSGYASRVIPDPYGTRKS